MEARPQAGPFGAHASLTHPGWGPSFAGGIAALVAGPAMGLSVCALAVWIVGALKGWPATFPSVSSDLFPQLGAGAVFAGIGVTLTAWLLDASIRRCVFRRLAGCEISLAATMVSVPLSPGLWHVTGIHTPLSWPVSVTAGVVFLRWRACAEYAVRRPPITRRAWVAVALTLALGGATGTAVVSGGPHIAAAVDGFGVIGPNASGSGGLDDWRPWPLDSVVGHRPSRVVYYRFEITNAGPLPIAVHSVGARASGPGLQVLATHIVGARAPTIHYGDATTVRVTLLAQRCPADSAASVSSVSRLVVGYSVLDGLVRRTTTFVLPKPLRLTCPAR